MLPLIDSYTIQIPSLLALAAASVAGSFRLIRYLKHQASAQKSVIDRINGLLPQTQCGQCGYAGCLPYARAISQGTAINQCPPGGEQTIIRLARLLNEVPLALNPAHGEHGPTKLAFIREAECIGCTKCIQACPVDAILGAAKLMHSVINEECTGCDLCVEPCPVDCIDMISIELDTATQWPLPSQLQAQASINGASLGTGSSVR